jgi:dethiobiotin synthetase
VFDTLFITGTDTAAGKTVVTSSLVAYWQKYHSNRQLGLMKPIQSGVGDREWYHKLFNLQQTVEETTPQYFQAPLAPPIAAARENREVDLGVVWQGLSRMRSHSDFTLVEALGGLGSPVTDELTVADIAGEWKLPTVLVVPVKLGSISHAVANVALARQAKINLLGIILNCITPDAESGIADFTPIELVQRFTNIPVLGHVPYLENLEDVEKLAQVASSWDLEILLPKNL